VFKKEYSIQLL